ncbi:similar to Saccharomyces cerevisiae YGR270W YTA7 Protein that localizes to chromatin and has a role in regulation of histone gene expression [Maudiozyma saulgeensis]|uniref:Similar to Saccharomyces cerevisiae YGR270W YTA7 Protein that localizes to chromatin and has a role in regulation of histone gene expression n=1 Tax=Maudiozyma saulgeensis TaxID=1789683 RepID=A0A1X7RB06_9SACH|nr:similar to Saccharomyces cerevisiae YGR270W YTA7 Protein that localizes to chromatin and has a role in regulation of histone gene expression [Kazachstania saulgeensis]
MPRSLRNRGPDDSNPDEITDENGVTHTTTRSLRRINYAEMDNIFDDDDDDDLVEPTPEVDNDATVPIAEQPNLSLPFDINDIEVPTNTTINNADYGNDDDDEYDEDIANNGKRNLRKRKQAHYDDDDESFHEEELDDDLEEDDDDNDLDDEYSEGYNNRDSKRRLVAEQNREDRNFVVPDPDDEGGSMVDEDDDEALYYSNRRRTARKNKKRHIQQTETPPRRNLRSTSMRGHTPEAQTDEDGYNAKHVTLADEIRELQEDSPINEKRSLRERTKPVDYTIPPLLSAATAEEYLERPKPGSFVNVSPARRGGRSWNSGGPVRRLFPTGGPFGGNDVTTIFGQNTNFYGNTNGTSALNRNDQNNKLILDSDSSDDEILPLGATPKEKKENPLKKTKKKPEIADLDPLGVDMNITFDEVGGLDNYIDQLKEMVTLPLLYPELYQNFNIMPPRGVLFHGPPGTGKTLMARALAASCSSESRKITFFMRKGADILSKWVGEAERQLRLLFEEAKKQQPSIIFFDEIDGLAPVRSSKQEQIHASIVSTMLALMDGMDNRGQVIVIGATNRPDAVDPALRRPGRFDREFYFPLPDEKARATILKIQTKKWNPQLPEKLVDGLAKLTKGYGGADLRALCTEAALSSIQRKYPQIYRSNDKLLVDPKKIRVNHKDFMFALKKIVPSSARQTGSVAEPLPKSVMPLLEKQFSSIKTVLNGILSDERSSKSDKATTIQHYIDYEDSDSETESTTIGGINKYEILDQIRESQICNPRMLITGSQGNGQQYIGAAILNHLEHYNVQKLDLGSLASESNRSIDAAIVQGFIEARKRQPSIIFIPNIDIWARSIPTSALSTLASLVRSLKSKEKILLLGLADTPAEELSYDETISQLYFQDNIFNIEKPQTMERSEYFKEISTILEMKPTEFVTERKRTKPLEELPVVSPNLLPENLDENGNPLPEDEILRRKLKKFQYQDMKLKNVLKIKLSGLMDLFKNRYKRFRKPTVDDSFLVHLFEPSADPNYQPAYVKQGDMILEIATGKKFFNMDLDIIEERLWNGYYSEPKQFLEDIELIYLDAMTVGDRERVIKASEMFANAQMGIEDISTPELIKECKITRRRDHERQQLYAKQLEQEKLTNNVETAIEGFGQETNAEVAPTADFATTDNVDAIGATEISTGAGSQVQAQLQINQNTVIPENPFNNGRDEVDVTKPVVIEKGEAKSSTGVGEKNNDNTSERDKLIDKTTDQSQVPVEDQFGTLNSEETHVEPKPETAIENSGIKEPEINSVSTTEELNEKPKELAPPKQEDTRIVTLDKTRLDEVISSLIKETDDFTVTALENIYSKVIRIIWENRQSWDKSETLAHLESYISKLNKRGQ